MNQADPVGDELQRFKTKMLIERPFYGDILLRLPIWLQRRPMFFAASGKRASR